MPCIQYTFAQFRSHFEYLNLVEQLKAHAHFNVKEKVDAQRQKSCRNITFVMRKCSVSLSVSAMIVKQGKHFTTAKIINNVCKTLFVTVTILSPNLLLNDFCFKIIVETHKITEIVHMTKVTFLHHFCR